MVIPHLLFYIVLDNGPFEGEVPSWLLWLTVVLHLLYMVSIRLLFRISII